MQKPRYADRDDTGKWFVFTMPREYYSVLVTFLCSIGTTNGFGLGVDFQKEQGREHRLFWKRKSRLASALFMEVPVGIPIDPEGRPYKFPAKEHCSKCGLCETSYVARVKEACAFLEPGMSRIDTLETKVHGRRRKTTDDKTIVQADERRFGVQYQPLRLARGISMPDAQWTGVVSSIAISMLETRQVDAVACVASNEETWSNPNPILAQTTDEVLKGRGVKPSLAPSLNILDEVKNDPSIRRLLFCGVGCSVQALRSIENELGIEIFILGTNCVDNSPSPGAAAEFIEKGAKVFSDSVRGYEFMQDFRVHVKTEETYLTIPYFCLPGTIAESSIAKSCRSCFDYTNALADVVVGYMAAPLDGKSRMDESWQTVTVRNERGNQMVETAITQGRLEVGDIARGSGDHQQLAIATTKSDALVQAMVGGKVQENGMPLWLGSIMVTVLRKVSAKGIAFARYSIDYHIVRNYFHVLNEWGEHRARSSTPQFALEIVDEYLEMDSTLKGYAAKLTSKH